MLRNRAFFKRTRRGKILRIVEDHYLRDDVGCGTLAGKPVSPADLIQLGRDSVMKQFLVLDTNVMLHQMDLLDNDSPPLSCIIVLQTVLEEVRHNNLSLYRRVRQLLKDESRSIVFFANEHHCETYLDALPGETPNNRNDRAIRVAAAWFRQQVGDAINILLITNDRDNMDIARKAGLPATTIHRYVESVSDKYPDLVEKLAQETSRDAEGGLDGEEGALARDSQRASSARAQRKMLFPEHKPMSELTEGIKAGRYFQGILRTDRGGWRQCYVIVQQATEEDQVAVMVRGAEHCNRAVEGDVVALEILPEDQWERGDAPAAPAQPSAAPDAEGADRDAEADLVPDLTAAPAPEDIENVSHVPTLRPCGRVVGIIRRNWRQYCGSLELHGDREAAGGRATSALFVPVDKKIPKVRIQTRQRAALAGKRILVAIDSWPAWCPHPLGHYLKTLGDSGDKGIETEVILLEHDIPHEVFSGKVLAELPPTDWQITPENSAGRRDLRHVPVLSIDPPGCKDIDDALHARPLENGNWEVGVHIADVTYFVEAGGAMDDEAASRSTSTYLVDKRLDMLPGLLTETLCSLRGGVDRFAFSVLWEMTADGDILNVQFCKSIIHSIAALTYNEAQMMIDDPNLDDVRARSVRQLNRLAKAFRARRIQAGALTLASPEVRFVLDSESQNPTDVQMYALKESNALVEEFMLLANITVGKKILRHFPTLSVLRRHPNPARSQFDSLLSSAAAVGIKLDVEDSKRLADSLDAAVRPDDPYFNKLLRILSTRCMMPAQYFCSGEKSQEDWHHYGLAAPIYTHFTSPIRRYADVIVHRLLAASIGVGPLPARLMSKAYVHDLTNNMNRRHRAAQVAGRASVALHTILYFSNHPTEEDAYVLAVSTDRITALTPRYGIEGTVYLTEEAASGYLKHDPDRHTLTYNAPGRTPVRLRVFDRIRVYIHVGEDKGQQRAVKMQLRQPVLEGPVECTVEVEEPPAPMDADADGGPWEVAGSKRKAGGPAAAMQGLASPTPKKKKKGKGKKGSGGGV